MIIETFSSIIILGIAVAFLNPGHLTMPDSLISMLILSFIVAFLTFVAFVLKEKTLDERESLHVLSAGRVSYLVGVGVLITGVIRQTLSHEVDPWLVISLCAMILSKLISRIYSNLKR